MAEPKLTPIKNGWAARGDGWAVHEDFDGLRECARKVA